MDKTVHVYQAGLGNADPSLMFDAAIVAALALALLALFAKRRSRKNIGD